MSLDEFYNGEDAVEEMKELLDLVETYGRERLPNFRIQSGRYSELRRIAIKHGEDVSEFSEELV